MNSHPHIEKRDDRGGHGGLGFWAVVGCCVPLIVVFALIALKVV